MAALDAHITAMDLAVEADDPKLSDERRRELFLAASEVEETAAKLLLENDSNSHLTAGVLYRSAAWLAIDGEDYARGIRLAGIGLDLKNLAPEIRKELFDCAEAALELAKNPKTSNEKWLVDTILAKR